MDLRRKGKGFAARHAGRRPGSAGRDTGACFSRTVMGLALATVLGALAWTAGCVAPPHSPNLTSAAPTRGVAPLSAGESRHLRGIGQAAADSLVHVVTVLRATPADASPSSGQQAMSFCTGGSGVIVAADGLILTSEHVCRDAAEIRVVLPDGRELPVEHLVVDRRLDLAVLKIAATGLPALTVSSRPLQPGMSVVAVARVEPDRPVTIRPGVIVATVVSLQQLLDPTLTRDYAGLIESTTRLEPGFSGGPLLDSAGRLIGLNVAAGTADGAHRGYAIPLGGAVRAAVYRLRAQAMARARQSEPYLPRRAAR